MGDEVESTSGNGAIARSGYTIGHLEHHMVPTSETQDQPQVSTPKVHPNARACDICRQMKVSLSFGTYLNLNTRIKPVTRLSVMALIIRLV